MTQVVRNKKSEFSQHKSNGFDSDFSFKPPVLPGLEFTISLKIIAKNYFQLNYSEKFSFA